MSNTMSKQTKHALDMTNIADVVLCSTFPAVSEHDELRAWNGCATYTPKKTSWCEPTTPNKMMHNSNPHEWDIGPKFVIPNGWEFNPKLVTSKNGNSTQKNSIQHPSHQQNKNSTKHTSNQTKIIRPKTRQPQTMGIRPETRKTTNMGVQTPNPPQQKQMGNRHKIRHIQQMKAWAAKGPSRQKHGGPVT